VIIKSIESIPPGSEIRIIHQDSRENENAETPPAKISQTIKDLEAELIYVRKELEKRNQELAEEKEHRERKEKEFEKERKDFQEVLKAKEEKISELEAELDKSQEKEKTRRSFFFKKSSKN